MVGERHQQAVARHGPTGRQTGHARGDIHPGIAGTRPAGDQRAANRTGKIIARGQQVGLDRPARDAGRPADRQDIAADIQHTRCLAVIAGDRQRPRQLHIGAAVDQAVRSDIDGIAQQQIARGQDHIGARAGNGTAREGARRTAAAIDHQRPARQVQDIAADRAAIVQRPQIARRCDIDRRRRAQAATIVDRRKAAADIVILERYPQRVIRRRSIGDQTLDVSEPGDNGAVVV